MLDKNVLLEGPRVRLRPVEVADVGQRYHDWMNDPEVNRYMETRFRRQTREDIRAHVEKMKAAADVLFWAMVDRASSRHIGNIKLGPISEIHRRGELSFFIGEKEFWGRGLTTEVVALVTEYALKTLGLHKVAAGCYSNNQGSIRVFEKVGYTRVATLPEHYLCEGRFVDRLCFEKLGVAP